MTKASNKCVPLSLSRPAPSPTPRHLSLRTRTQNKSVSDREATKAALLSSPVLLWDVSGLRQEQQIPPVFSVRATRSWLLSAWARYSLPLKVGSVSIGLGGRIERRKQGGRRGRGEVP